MSDSATTEAPSKSASMSPADIEFLITCLNNTTGGSIAVNVQKLASELGYTNPKSASNRLATLRKKYNLPISASSAKSNTEGSDDADGDTADKVVVTPKKRTPKPAAEKKAKVTKTPTKPRKGANVKAKPEQMVAEESGAADDEDEKMGDQEVLAVHSDGSSSLSEAKNSEQDM